MADSMLSAWFSKIETHEQALVVIKDTSNVFFFVAVLLFALGGGQNIILAVIVLWAAVRAVQATYKFRNLTTTSTKTHNSVAS